MAKFTLRSLITGNAPLSSLIGTATEDSAASLDAVTARLIGFTDEMLDRR